MKNEKREPFIKEDKILDVALMEEIGGNEIAHLRRHGAVWNVYGRDTVLWCVYSTSTTFLLINGQV